MTYLHIHLHTQAIVGTQHNRNCLFHGFPSFVESKLFPSGHTKHGNWGWKTGAQLKLRHLAGEGPRLMKRFWSCGHVGCRNINWNSLQNNSYVNILLNAMGLVLCWIISVGGFSGMDHRPTLQLAHMTNCIPNTHTHGVGLNMETRAVFLTSMALWLRQ